MCLKTNVQINRTFISSSGKFTAFWNIATVMGRFVGKGFTLNIALNKTTEVHVQHNYIHNYNEKGAMLIVKEITLM